MNYQEIAELTHSLNDEQILLPLNRDGEYLDWTTITEDKKYAKSLTNEQEYKFYTIGDNNDKSGMCFYFDYNFLPDSRAVISGVKYNKQTKEYTDRKYIVCSIQDSPTMARDLLHECNTELINEDIAHDEEYHDKDAYYMARVIAKELSIEPYEYMSDFELKFNSYPRF